MGKRECVCVRAWVLTVQVLYDHMRSHWQAGMAAKLRQNYWLSLVAGPMTEGLGSAWLRRKSSSLSLLKRNQKSNKRHKLLFFLIPSPLQKHYFLKTCCVSLQSGRQEFKRKHLAKSIAIRNVSVVCFIFFISWDMMAQATIERNVQKKQNRIMLGGKKKEYSPWTTQKWKKKKKKESQLTHRHVGRWGKEKNNLTGGRSATVSSLDASTQTSRDLPVCLGSAWQTACFNNLLGSWTCRIMFRVWLERWVNPRKYFYVYTYILKKTLKNQSFFSIFFSSWSSFFLHSVGGK